jgi:hypothetical protein
MDAWVIGSGAKSSAATMEFAFGGDQARPGFLPFPRLVWPLELCLLFGMLWMPFLFLTNFSIDGRADTGFRRAVMRAALLMCPKGGVVLGLRLERGEGNGRLCRQKNGAVNVQCFAMVMMACTIRGRCAQWAHTYIQPWRESAVWFPTRLCLVGGRLKAQHARSMGLNASAAKRRGRQTRVFPFMRLARWPRRELPLGMRKAGGCWKI